MSSRPVTVRRSLGLRALALLSACALLLAGGTDAYGLHRCAHHDALPGEGAAHGAGAAHGSGTGHAGHAPAAHDDMGSAHGSGVDLAAPSPPGDAPEHEGGCTCVGDCAGADAAVTRDEPTAGWAPAMSTEVDAPAARPAVKRVEWLLPPGNGPPALT